MTFPPRYGLILSSSRALTDGDSRGGNRVQLLLEIRVLIVLEDISNEGPLFKIPPLERIDAVF